jgi:general secretion pathway protein M
MIVIVREWLGQRSVRERRMLLAMAAIAVPLLVWLLIIRPLSAAYDDALEQHLDAVDRNGRVRSLIDTANARPDITTRFAPIADIGLVVTEMAGQSGLTVETSPQGNDRVGIAIAQAPAAGVMRWFADLEARGLVVDEWRLSPAGDGSVAVTGQVRKAS